MSETMMLKSGYSQDNAEPREYRFLTLEEIQNYTRSYVSFIDKYGKVRDAKVNGAVKLWKTRPNDVRMPLKYGLREYFFVQFEDGIQTWGPYLVVEV
jgi:hypothetical protein